MLVKLREKKSGLNLSSSQRAAIYDGNAWASMVGFGETYLSPFSIFLKGSNLQLSLIASLPPFFGALAQIFCLWLLQFTKSRRKLVSFVVSLHAIVWLVLGLTPIMFDKGESAVWAVIILASIAMVCGNAGGPAWNSLIGDMVPADIRGRYFGLRNFTMGFYTFVAITSAGQLLNEADSMSITAYGFSAIFIAASIARFASCYWSTKYDDIPHEIDSKRHHFTFFDFLKRTPKSNFAKFVFYISIINAAVAFSGPFFTVYMLNVLKLSYTEFTFVTVTNTIVQFLVMQYWGKLADHFGNKNILNLLGYGVAISPILWVFNGTITYLITIQIFNGFVWAGFNLAAANFLFDAVSPAKRARCTAYQNVVNGILVLAGALAGGAVADLVPSSISILGISWIPQSPLMLLFIISGLVRIIASFTLLPIIKDAANRKPIKHYDLLFQMARMRPISGASFEVVGSDDKEVG